MDKRPAIAQEKTEPESSHRLKEHWDKTWTSDYSVEERVTDPYIGIRDSKLLHEVLEHLRWRSRPLILEAGCGLGIWQVELERCGHRIVGLDYSLTGLEVAKDYQQGLALINGDILSFPFRDGSFDAILSWGVIEHFEDTERLKLSLSEKRRILDKGGRVFITVPVDNLFIRAKGLVRQLPFFRLFTNLSPPFFEHKFRSRQFLEMLQAAGFSVLVWRYHASDFGLAMSIPGLFRAPLKGNRYQGLSALGKIVHACSVRWFPILTAHQIFVVAEKQDP
jgi:SAM-dependent methyltransferase